MFAFNIVYDILLAHRFLID